MDKAVTRQVKRRYPLTITDLTKPELESLTTILLLENPSVYQIVRTNVPSRINEDVKESIKKLPCALRKSKIVQMMPSTSIGRAAVMCPSHNGLNAYLMAHLFDLVKAEVTERLATLDEHANEIPPFEEKLLRSIQAMGRIWGARTPEETSEPTIGAPHFDFQTNKCEACMLARVAREPLFLRNLRIALLSRTRMKKKHRAPRLLRFVDGCIRCHEGYAFRVLHESNQLAIDFKLARKGTVVVSRERRGRPGERGDQKESNTKSIVVYLDPDLRRQYMTDADEAAYLPKGKGASDHDTLADEIIPMYEQMSPNEPLDPAPRTVKSRSRDMEGLQTIKPLSIEKNASGSPGSPNKPKQTLAGNIPSRDKLDWQKVMECQKGPLDSLTSKYKTIKTEEAGFSGREEDVDALGAEYRGLISRRTLYDSESEYSQALSDDDPVEELSPYGTTWSLLMRDVDTPPGGHG